MSQRKADILIAMVYMAWGISYIFMKIGLEGIMPFNLIALRFGIAFIVTSVLFYKKLVKTERKTAGYSAVLGFILFCIFSCLMFGLKTMTASSAGFLTATTVIFVPMLKSITTKKMPELSTIVGVCVAFAGMILMTSGDSGISLQPETGTVLCMAAALLYAVHIIMTDKFTRETDGFQLGVFQLGFSALFALIASLLFENPALPDSLPQWGAVLGLALLCSAFGFVAQSVAQKYTTPERTGVLYALEPVFSALFGFIFLHEVLQIRNYAGAVLILASVGISSIKKAVTKMK